MTTLFTGTCGPVAPGTRITQPYGFDPTYPGNAEHVHHGLDFGVVVGPPLTATPEVSTVVRAGAYEGTGYGLVVILRYSDGTGRTWYLLHAHLSEVKVTVGQTIVRGMTVGLSGNSGFSTGPHLHFARGLEGYWKGAWEDPLPWLLSLEVDDVLPEDRALLDWVAANKGALSTLAIAARDAGFDAAHDTAATNDDVSRGIRRGAKVFRAWQLDEATLRAMPAGELRDLVIDLINVEVP